MALDEVLCCALENIWVLKDVVLDFTSSCHHLNGAVLYGVVFVISHCFVS